MKRDQIDAELERHGAAETRIATNLHDLQDNPTYRMISNGTLTGTSAERLGPALQGASRLWELFARYRDVLDDARSARGTDNRLSNEERDRLTALLREPSVVVVRRMTPVTERDLLGAGSTTDKITLDDALEQMRTLYAELRDGVAAVQAVQRDLLPRLDAASTTLAAAQSDATEIGVEVAELDRAARRLDQVRIHALDDPLSLPPSEGEKLDQLVRVAAQKVASLVASHANLDTDIGSMTELLAEIRTLRAQAEAAHTEAQAKILAPADLRAVPSAAAIDGTHGLAARGKTLVSGPASSWQARRASVDAWLDQARRLREQLVGARDANRVGLERRDELRGLFQAYQAKVHALGHAEDHALSELADEARNELFTAPTDLDRAHQLVRQIGLALRG